MYDKRFSLHDSMSASEIGDAKMDIKVAVNEADNPEKCL